MKLFAIISAILATLTGCQTIPPAQAPSVRSEQTLAVALAAVDAFLAFESAQGTNLPPSVRVAAAAVRRDAARAIVTANTLRMAYKSNRTPGGEANLLTALAVVESIVGQVRVWMPSTTASGLASQRYHTRELADEAAAHGSVQTTQSFAVLVPLIIDLSREVFKAVNAAREAAKQVAEWSAQQDAEFTLKISNVTSQAHWK